MKKEEAKAVLFDLDDTLCNSKKASENAILEFKGNYNELKNVNDPNFAKIWYKIGIDTYERFHNKEISYEQLKIDRMKNLYNYYSINISEEDAKEKFINYQEIYENNWILYDDVKDLLENIKNKYRLVILSNGNGKQQRKKIEFTGLNEYFSDIIISSEVGYSKPQKEIFEIACKMINVNPENCIMVGDKYTVDVEGGINAGMTGIWVNRNKEKSNYEFQINELIELNKFLT